MSAVLEVSSAITGGRGLKPLPNVYRLNLGWFRPPLLADAD